ncbi:2,3-bisphosphoglycerate-independent phosphoglycerate mutase [Candidatus Micrarchaeota archaeon]|nr:2,3-bisphosphoglycerate-independent phosphoglycerate mutase [Candidatus Micrarchaeota archaeon]
MKRKAVLIVCDGLGDLQINGKTPLQMAKKPNLDRMVSHGSSGLMYSIGPGIIPGSDTSHLAILGYDPKQYYSGRGTFEALGVGIKLEKNDIAFRCNFGTVDRKFRILDRRAGRIKDEGKILEKEIDRMKIEDVTIIFKASVEHRAALVLRGPGLSRNISDVDPHEVDKLNEAKPLDGSSEARKTARIINLFTKKSYEILSKHWINKKREAEGKMPANIILTRGPGIYEPVISIKEKFGFSSACIAGGALYKGIAKYLGMEILEVKGATGRYDSDLVAKGTAAVQALKKHEFVFIHVKGTDNAGHDGNLKEKVRMIEKVDKMIGVLIRKSNSIIALTSDHSTPVSLKAHSGHAVPIVLYGDVVRRDGIKSFDEISCAKGSLGILRGLDVMPILTSLMGYSKMYGS